MPEPTHDTLPRLRDILAESGLSQVALARALGRDERSMRRWLAGTQAIPETLAAQIARVVRIEVTAERVALVMRR